MDLHRRLTSNHAVFARKQHDLACIARAECLHRSDRSSEHDAPVGPGSLDEAVGMQGPELPGIVRHEALVAAELGHPLRGRLAHQHLGAGYLEQSAPVDDAEPVAEGLCLTEVVGHEYGRCSRALTGVGGDAAQEGSGGGVHRRERLIEQESSKRPGDRAGQAGALTLTPGERVGRGVGEPAQTYLLEESLDGNTPDKSSSPDPVGDVVAHAQMGKQRGRLANQRDAALSRFYRSSFRSPRPSLVRSIDEAAVEPDPAAFESYRAGNRFQAGGLA